MKMRSFIGLDLPVDTKLNLESWRTRALPEIVSRDTAALPKNTKQPPARPVAVPAANFHITLAFLGHIDMRQHEALVAGLAGITLPPFELALDSTGLWNGPKVLYCAPQSVPDALVQLARQVRKTARAAGIVLDGKPYQPHVTLVRKATALLPPPLFSPNERCHFDEFHLFESLSTAQGVSYPIRQSWQLQHNLSVRERLRRGLA